MQKGIKFRAYPNKEQQNLMGVSMKAEIKERLNYEVWYRYKSLERNYRL